MLFPENSTPSTVKTVLFLLLLSPVTGWAQVLKITPQDTQRKQSFLLMRDGSVVRGQILRQDSTIISVRKRGGDLSFIEADQVISVLADRSDLPENMASARTASPYKVYVMKDGARIEGMFIRRDSTMITLQKPNGQFTYFEPELLARIDTVQGESFNEGSQTLLNRFAPYLLTGLTAYNPEKKQFAVRSAFLLVNNPNYVIAQLPSEVNYGITRNWSVGAGVDPFVLSLKNGGSLNEDAVRANVRFFSKISFPVGKQVRFGVNVVYQPSQRLDLFPIVGQWTFQGLASFGDSQRNVTLGYGRNAYRRFSLPANPFITVGVMHKIGRSLTFISDNTFSLNPYRLGTSANLSAALRFSHQRHAIDLGALAFIYPYVYYNQWGIYPRAEATRARFSPYLGYILVIGRD